VLKVLEVTGSGAMIAVDSVWRMTSWNAVADGLETVVGDEVGWAIGAQWDRL